MAEEMVLAGNACDPLALANQAPAVMEEHEHEKRRGDESREDGARDDGGTEKQVGSSSSLQGDSITCSSSEKSSYDTYTTTTTAGNGNWIHSDDAGNGNHALVGRSSSHSRSSSSGDSSTWSERDVAHSSLSKALSSLLKRRRRLKDVFEFSKYNALDPARKEMWDDIEELRQRAAEANRGENVQTETNHTIDDVERTAANDSMSSKYRWSDQAWKQLFEELILSHTLSTMQSTRDDLLYFVQDSDRLRSRASSTSSDTQKASIGHRDEQNALIVRRWNPILPDDIETMSDCFQWQHSLLLNLVLQTQYVITIAVYDSSTLYKKRDLRSQNMSPSALKAAEAGLKPIMEMRKRVYASPHFENVDSSSSAFTAKDTGTGMQESYPTLFFSVCDDSCSGQQQQSSGFESVVLSDPQCLCVILNASLEEDVWGRSAAAVAESLHDTKTSNQQRRSTSVKLFSGFVTHAQVAESYQENVGWMNYFRSNAFTKLSMRGPRGKGRAEVAVGDLAPDKSTSGQREPESSGLISKMASLTVRSVVNVAKEAMTKGKESDKTQQLTCSLVSLELPWEAIAHDLLKTL